MIRKLFSRSRCRLFALATVVGLLAACGGGPPPATNTARAGATRPAQVVYDPGSALQPGRGHGNFGNFNAALWNEHEWYECHCSRDPQPPEARAPWG